MRTLEGSQHNTHTQTHTPHTHTNTHTQFQLVYGYMVGGVVLPISHLLKCYDDDTTVSYTFFNSILFYDEEVLPMLMTVV